MFPFSKGISIGAANDELRMDPKGSHTLIAVGLSLIEYFKYPVALSQDPIAVARKEINNPMLPFDSCKLSEILNKRDNVSPFFKYP